MPARATRLSIAATTLAGSAALLAGFAPAAPAKAKPKPEAKVVSQCTGTRLESRPLTGLSGKQRGHVELWYSAKEGGTNCVMTYDDAGGAHEMSATLVVQDVLTGSDTGTFEYFAGGAAVTRTAGHCVQWGGYVWFGKKQFMYTNDRWSHCG